MSLKPQTPRFSLAAAPDLLMLGALLLVFAGPASAWPHLFNDEVHSSPMVADLEGDGVPEVIVLTTDGMLNVLGPDDSPTAGWPRLICQPSPISDGQNWVSGSAAVANLDGVGGLEILQAGFDGRLHAFSALGTELPGFPIQMGTYSTDTPTVADLDRDGDLEVICRYNPGFIGVWSHLGQMLPGWPRPIANAPGGAIDVWSCPAVADLDGNGDLEIVAGDYAGFCHAWHHTGATVAGWPVDITPTGTPTGWALSSPAAADFDGDGRDEVMIGSDDDRLYLLEGDGGAYPGWPRILPFGFRASPALGDLDGDGDLEIVIGHRTSTGMLQLHALHHNGSEMAGWPVSQPAPGGGYTFGWLSAILADLTGDGRPEVIAVKERRAANPDQAEIWAFGPDGGAALPGFPIALEGLCYAMPSVADFDLDGMAEILVGDLTRRLYKIDLAQSLDPDREALEWWRFQKDLAHTGRFAADPADVITEPLSFVRNVWAAPNPFRGHVTLGLRAEPGARETRDWRIVDPSGRRIRILPFSGGSIVWDGRGDGGMNAAPGVYFAVAPNGAALRLVKRP